MKKSELLKTLVDYKIIPRKKLGQNFLIDNNILEIILKNINFKKGSKDILEVGPGCGILSKKILQEGCQLTTVEIDVKIQNFLEDTFVKEPNFCLIKQDACQIDINQIMKLPRSFRCISNLPYAISSVFISRLLECLSPPEEAFFLLQEEMADRLIAKPCTKNYNSLSIRVQCIYKVKIIKRISPSVFYPVPKVNSAFLSLIKQKNEYKHFTKLTQLTRQVFGQRRKKFVKIAKNLYPEKNLIDILQENNLSINVRPEEITVEQFKKIVAQLQNL